MSVEVFNIDQLRSTLNSILETASGRGSNLDRAFRRAGSVIANEMRIQYRRSGLRRVTGRLANSLNYRVDNRRAGLTLEVGSFGVPYAGVHEFGGTFQVPSHTRRITQAFGRPIQPQTIQVRPHQRTVPARQYIRPAIVRQQANVARIIAEELER